MKTKTIYNIAGVLMFSYVGFSVQIVIMALLECPKAVPNILLLVVASLFIGILAWLVQNYLLRGLRNRNSKN